jgi:branched-chain amino acid transport system ATP-binding protein
MFLDIKNISKRFGGLQALEDVSFSVDRGMIFGLIGPNGAGKTTMFNIIAGIYKPTAGEVVFKDKEISRKPNYRRVQYGIARTFQNIRLFPNLTVLDNVRIGLHTKGSSSLMASVFQLPSWRREEGAIMETAMKALSAVGLGERAEVKAAFLPYGEQRLLELVRGLVTDAELLLLDEPAAGLNSVETTNLVEVIRKIRSEWRRTVLLVEHDMSLVMSICEHIVVLDHGMKIAEGDCSAIQNNPKVIEAYLGRRYADGIKN